MYRNGSWFIQWNVAAATCQHTQAHQSVIGVRFAVARVGARVYMFGSLGRSDVEEILGKWFVTELAKEIAKELRASNDGWVSQVGSPLGPRRHCAAVRRRLERGDPGASHPDKKRFLLSREALVEEMQTLGVAKPLVKTDPGGFEPVEAETTVRDRLLRKLGRR